MEKLSNELLDEVISNLTEDVRDLKKHDKNDMLTTATSWLIFLEELKEYRKLEEQGLLLKPKCKDGQDIYMESPYWGIIPYKVNTISYSKLTGFVYEVIASDNDELLDDQEIDDSDFGEIAFFTEEEAKEKIGVLS